MKEKIGYSVRIPLAELLFSRRTSNCFKGPGMKTLGDLVSKTEEELLDYPNFGEKLLTVRERASKIKEGGYSSFGKKSLTEIKEVLLGMGLSLGMKLDKDQSTVEGYVESGAEFFNLAPSPRNVKDQMTHLEFTTTRGRKVKIVYKPSGGLKVSDPKAFEKYLKKVADLLEIGAKEVDNGRLYEKDGKIVLEAQKNCVLKHPGHKSIVIPEGTYEVSIEREKRKENFMDKKQLIVAWVMGITVCATLFFYPKLYFVGVQGGQFYLDKSTLDKMKNTEWSGVTGSSMPVMQWSYIIPICLTIFIIGGLLVYTLRHKKE